MATQQTTSTTSCRVKSGKRISSGRPSDRSLNNNTQTPPRVGSASKHRLHSKPSDRLNPKTTDPFSKKIPKSVFIAAYSKGAVPCRLCHGSVKHKIEWTTSPDELQYDSVLVMFAEGLKELEFPYNFVAHQGFIQLLEANGAKEKTLPVLPKLIAPIKAALMVSDDDCFQATLDGIAQLSHVVGPAMNVHVKNVLPQISRRFSNCKQHREKITHVLNAIESHGGLECTPIIKSRIPTYSSVL